MAPAVDDHFSFVVILCVLVREDELLHVLIVVSLKVLLLPFTQPVAEMLHFTYLLVLLVLDLYALEKFTRLVLDFVFIIGVLFALVIRVILLLLDRCL